MTRPTADTVQPSAERAVRALSRATLAAEGNAPGELVVASRADLEVLPLDVVRVALDRVLLGSSPESGLDALLDGGVLPALLPEVHAMIGFSDGEWRHKDVWKHTKQVVAQATPRVEVRWGSLLHDIGKVKTRSISPDGEVHFFGHAEVGARMFDKLNKRLPLFKDEEALREEIRFLILHHLRAAQYDASWTDSAVRRFAKEIGPYLDDLLCLSRADITTKRPEKKRRGLRQIDELAERVRQIREEDAKVPPLPKGLGTAIAERFGIPPSPALGTLMRALTAAVEAGEVPAQQPADVYLDFLAQHAERFGVPKP
ncbi:MAG: HDIG domain-containing protein [Deltaproteobacteria bacterium]|nr:HDIG domain-containing protein [Deltaproteobacteria bacterium]